MEITEGVIYSVTQNNIYIKNADQIKSRSKMKEILYTIQHNHPECKVFKRSYGSMISEWITYNRLFWLYKIKTLNIEFPLKWYMKLFYTVFGI